MCSDYEKCFLLFCLIFLITGSTFSQNIQSLVLQPDPDDGIDAYINSASAFSHVNFGDCISLISSAFNYQGDYGIGKSLLKFDLSMLPPDAVIISASLSLYFDPFNAHGVQTGDNASYLRRITIPWEEKTVTLSTCPVVTDVNQVLLPTSESIYED